MTKKKRNDHPYRRYKVWFIPSMNYYAMVMNQTFCSIFDLFFRPKHPTDNNEGTKQRLPENKKKKDEKKRHLSTRTDQFSQTTSKLVIVAFIIIFIISSMPPGSQSHTANSLTHLHQAQFDDTTQTYTSDPPPSCIHRLCPAIYPVSPCNPQTFATYSTLPMQYVQQYAPNQPILCTFSPTRAAAARDFAKKNGLHFLLCLFVPSSYLFLVGLQYVRQLIGRQVHAFFSLTLTGDTHPSQQRLRSRNSPDNTDSGGLFGK